MKMKHILEGKQENNEMKEFLKKERKKLFGMQLIRRNLKMIKRTEKINGIMLHIEFDKPNSSAFRKQDIVPM